MVRRIAAAAVVAGLAGCSGNGGGSGEEFSVEIDGPVSPAHTNGVLTFQIDVHGGRADSVELRRDGMLLTTLSYPYLWAWDTSAIAEGEYAVIAVAMKGEETVQSNPVSVTVDRTAPAILSQSPLPDAEDVDVYGTVTVVLDEAIDERTIDAAQIVFASGTPVTGAYLSADKKTLTLDAFADFNPTPNIATVDLSEVRDLAGNPIASGNWSYELPAWLSLGAADRVPASDAGEPAIAVGSDLNPIVAFLEDGDLFVSRWNGAAWLPLGGALDAVAANTVASPVISADAANPVVAWIEWDASTGGSQHLLRTAQWNGSSWDSLGALNETSGDATDPVLLVDDNGDALLAWNEGGRVRAALRPDTAWVAKNTGLPATSSASGTFLSDAGGTTRLALRESDGSVRAYAFDGTSWSALPGTVSPAARADVSISFDANYNVPVVAVVEEVSTGVFGLRVRQWDGFDEWYDMTGSAPTSSTAAANPRLTNAAIGNGGFFPEEDAPGDDRAVAEGRPAPAPLYPSLQLVWNEGGDVHAAVFDFFEWSSMGVADHDPAAAAGNPSVAHDGGHNLFLAWDEADEDASSIRIGRMNRR